MLWTPGDAAGVFFGTRESYYARIKFLDGKNQNYFFREKIIFGHLISSLLQLSEVEQLITIHGFPGFPKIPDTKNFEIENSQIPRPNSSLSPRWREYTMRPGLFKNGRGSIRAHQSDVFFGHLSVKKLTTKQAFRSENEHFN